VTTLFKRIIQTVDSHTEGNPTRIVLSGIKVPPGETLQARNDWLKNNDDALRRLLNFEPRGNSMMCSVYVLPAIDPNADLAAIITEQDEYVPMSGHCIIGTATTVVAAGLAAAVEPVTSVTFETLAGLVRCDVQVKGGRLGAVSFDNVPSFLLLPQAAIALSSGRKIVTDVAFGGCFYAIVDADALELDLAPTNESAIIAAARDIIAALNAQHSIVHPDNPAIARCYQTLFRSRHTTVGDIKQVIVAPPGALDRSPCGTGASAHLATMVARGDKKLGDSVRFEGLMGTIFTAEVKTLATRDNLTVITPRITGRAYITGFHQFVLDPDDPFPEGLRVGDAPRDQRDDSIWGASSAGSKG
jgi:proline racemase